MKALNVRCHVGAQIGAQVYTSLDSKVNGCDMTMTQHGVFVTGAINSKPIEPHFIPMGTIASIRLCAEDVKPILEGEEKRKPGRPKAE